MSQANTKTGLTLYGAPCSLYTGKVRSYLRKNAIPFEERFASSAHYRDVIRPAVQNHRVPVVEFADGNALQDSTVILSELERRFPEIARPGGALRIVELFLEAYAERSLLKAAMHYRWSFPDENGDFILGEFGRILAFSQGPSAWPEAGKQIADRMSAYLPLLGIDKDSIPAIESSYLKLLTLLNAHFSAHPYLLGGAPSRADYGLMGPLYAHLGRDPYPLRIMQRQAPLVMRWVERMNAPEPHSPEFPDRPLAFFAETEVAPSFLAVLRHAVVEYEPELMATVKAFKAWTAANPDAPAGSFVSAKGVDQPSLGLIEYPLEGKTVRQMSSAHTLWMLQHVLDAWISAPAQTQARARQLFDAAGAGHVLDLRLPRRLTRRDNRLAIEQ